MRLGLSLTAIKMHQPSHLQALFHSLAGTWSLDRDLVSANVNEPSGRCVGRATLTSRTPSPIVDGSGSLHLANGEMLYHETGEFRLPNNMTVPFTKKYVWRLSEDIPKISLWFTKPGTEVVDYLFHDADIVFDGDSARGTGGHLCVDDFYSTSYTFQLTKENESAQPLVTSWETVHEVQGPKKEQTLTTRFSRENKT
jgi:hypothetical protein